MADAYDRTPTVAPPTKKDAARALIAAAQSRIGPILGDPKMQERMLRVVSAEFQRNPDLLQCTSESFLLSMILAAQLRLEPSSPIGHMYLIPFNVNVAPKGAPKQWVKVCTPIIGYKGYTELARRSGEVARINANVIYRDEITKGLFRASIEPPEIHHEFSLDDVNRADDQIVGAYCRVDLKGGGVAQIVMTRGQIEAHRARSRAGQSGPWVTDYASMCRKTPIRVLMSGGTVPLSAELRVAIEADVEVDGAPDAARFVPDAEFSGAPTSEQAEDAHFEEPAQLPPAGERPPSVDFNAALDAILGAESLTDLAALVSVIGPWPDAAEKGQLRTQFDKRTKELRAIAGAS